MLEDPRSIALFILLYSLSGGASITGKTYVFRNCSTYLSLYLSAISYPPKSCFFFVVALELERSPPVVSVLL